MRWLGPQYILKIRPERLFYQIDMECGRKERFKDDSTVFRLRQTLEERKDKKDCGGARVHLGTVKF